MVPELKSLSFRCVGGLVLLKRTVDEIFDLFSKTVYIYTLYIYSVSETCVKKTLTVKKL